MRFDCEHKAYNMYEMSGAPPGISYGEFSDPHVMCVEGSVVFVHTPGKPSLLFDESRSEWITHQRRSVGAFDFASPSKNK